MPLWRLRPEYNRRRLGNDPSSHAIERVCSVWFVVSHSSGCLGRSNDAGHHPIVGPYREMFRVQYADRRGIVDLGQCQGVELRRDRGKHVESRQGYALIQGKTGRQRVEVHFGSESRDEEEYFDNGS